MAASLAFRLRQTARRLMLATRRADDDRPLLSFRAQHAVARILSWLPLSVPFLIRLFGSDKDRAGEHAFGDAYSTLARGRRLRQIRLVEIGILSGASLLAWRAVFPRGTIIGCDIAPKDHMRVGALRIHRLDQGSETALEAMARAEGPFDIIIDDGSHLIAHQLLTFRVLFPHLKDGGIFVIEDVQTSYWPGTEGGAHVTDPAFAHSCVGHFLEVAKYINHAEFWSHDDVDPDLVALGRRIRRITFEQNLIVIEKGPNTLPSNSLELHRRMLAAHGRS